MYTLYMGTPCFCFSSAAGNAAACPRCVRAVLWREVVTDAAAEEDSDTAADLKGVRVSSSEK